MAQTTLGVMISNRVFFADWLVEQGRKTILEVLEKMGIRAIIVDPSATHLGAVETLADAQQCAALFKAHQDEIEGILISLPNFGNEKGVADAIRLSGLRVPVLVHAFPDDTAELTIAGRRDAFCGKLSACNVLYQYGIPYSLTEDHTIDPNSAAFEAEIRRFVQTCKVVNGMRHARLGAIGARPDAFKTVRFSEKLFDNFGIDVSTVDLSDVFGWAGKLSDDDPKVKAKLDEITGYAKSDKVPARPLVRMAKLGIVISDWMQENQINATAIQCWESMQKNYGINACTLMSMMSDKLMPSACETDVAGTASMYALTLASGTPSVLVDWNNNYNNERDKCLIFHCGNWAKSLAPDAEIIQAEVLGTTLGKENSWGALQGRAPAGPLTFARIDTDDRRGVIHTYVGEGAFTNDPLSTISGTHAVVEVRGLQDLLRTLCRLGFAHHCAFSASQTASVLEEAFGQYLGWEVYRHQN